MLKVSVFHVMNDTPPGHHCLKELHVMLMDEEGDSSKNGLTVEAVLEKEAAKDWGIKLSMNPLVGFTEPITMKSRVYIRSKVVTILINCSTTSNFLTQDLVEELQLHLYVNRVNWMTISGIMDIRYWYAYTVLDIGIANDTKTCHHHQDVELLYHW